MRSELALLLILLTGCGSIMLGSRQDIGISSTPTGARVMIDNQEKGVTPLFADLKRKDNHIVKIELAGYLPYETTITRKITGWVWGNIIFGGIIGLAVDAISGGLYKLTPDQVAATLTKEQQTLKTKDGNIYIAVVLAPDPKWQKIGQLIPAAQ